MKTELEWITLITLAERSGDKLAPVIQQIQADARASAFKEAADYVRRKGYEQSFLDLREKMKAEKKKLQDMPVSV